MRTRTVVAAGMIAVAVLAIATLAALEAMHRGATVRDCLVIAALDPAAEHAPAAPASMLEAFPALRSALDAATADAAGLARLPSCEARDDLLAALVAAGAPRAEGGDAHLLRHAERGHRVQVVKAVA